MDFCQAVCAWAKTSSLFRESFTSVEITQLQMVAMVSNKFSCCEKIWKTENLIKKLAWRKAIAGLLLFLYYYFIIDQPNRYLVSN
ncbi:Uncharacterized protein APZ42_034039 [Daphnia magna]|uniref:Uncharacterized protein n=1 Tax=Daphnia magna TaxID=35525 RepID=A0A164KI48_9CRUS|nr:Uncharacterized protein APZ42_034039 [Daphnia magna]